MTLLLSTLKTVYGYKSKHNGGAERNYCPKAGKYTPIADSNKMKKQSRQCYCQCKSPAIDGMKKAHRATFAFCGTGLNHRTYGDLDHTASN